MKRILSILAVLACCAGNTFSQTVDGLNFDVDGFAAYPGTAGTNWYHEGGTTGGQGGKVVKADNFAQLQAYLQSSNPYIVLVDHDITTGIKCYVDGLSTGHLCDVQDGSEGVETTYGERIMVASNKTLIGIADANGNAPLFTHITFVMQSVSNVIIRNCRFTMVGVPILKNGENKIVAWRDNAQIEVGDPDCIGIQADKESASKNFGSHIWVDHCEFFNGDAANKDRYDGLLDCKNNVQWLTVSYNFFHNHDKSCLWGKGDSDCYDGCRTISAHHNFFQNIDGSRLPLQRGGNVHYMNNYQEGCSDGWDLRTKSVGYADACYFKNSKAPILPDGGGELNICSEDGYGVIYDNCQRVITNSSAVTYINAPSKYDATFDASTYVKSTWTPTQTVSSYFIYNRQKTVDVPAFCEKYSGAGKITIWNTYTSSIPAASNADYVAATQTQSTAGCYDANGNKVAGISGSTSGDDSGSGSDSGSSDEGTVTSDATYDFAVGVGTTDGTTGTPTTYTAKTSFKLGSSSEYIIIKAKSGDTFKNGDIIEITGQVGSAGKNMGLYLNTIATKAGTSVFTAAASKSTNYTAKGTLTLSANATQLYLFRFDATSTTISSLKIYHPATDAINSISTSPSTTATYSLDGRCLSAPEKGLPFIKNGKKYIAK